jgi:hypothetical protein
LAERKAYMSVSGQNSNNSVRASNSFINDAKNGEDWNLVWRTEKDKAAEEDRELVSQRPARYWMLEIFGIKLRILLGPVQTLGNNWIQPSTNGTHALKEGGSMDQIVAQKICSSMILHVIWLVSNYFIIMI